MFVFKMKCDKHSIRTHNQSLNVLPVEVFEILFLDSFIQTIWLKLVKHAVNTKIWFGNILNLLNLILSFKLRKLMIRLLIQIQFDNESV